MRGWNHRCSSVHPRLGRSLLCVLLFPGTAAAQAEWHPYVGSQYEYNSNVFDLASRAEALSLTGNANRADTDWRSYAGIDADYTLDRDKLGITAEGRRVLYDRFSQLDHNEYLLSGRFDWKLLTNWDGFFDGGQERRLVSYADRVSTQREMEVDRRADAGINVNLTPEWRVETTGNMENLHSPLPGFPDFRLEQQSGSAALKYIGVDRLAAGLQGIYSSGKFIGTSDNASFDQVTGVLTLKYTVSGISDFDGNVGYTRFKGHGAQGGSVNGLSGALQYTRHLSIKTDAHAEVFRRVSGYVAGADAVTDTGADAGVSWQATPKISLAGSYTWTYTEYNALAAAAAAAQDAGRRDHFQQSTVEMRYAALRWMMVRIYGNYYNRGSNVGFDTFNQALAGIELRLRMP